MNEVFLNQNHDTCTGGKGLLCTAVKTGSTATTASFTYTPWGQIATRKDKTGTVTDTTSYAYDGMGRVTTIGYPSGISAGYGYADGHLEINGVRVIDLKDQWGQSH